MEEVSDSDHGQNADGIPLPPLNLRQASSASDDYDRESHKRRRRRRRREGSSSSATSEPLQPSMGARRSIGGSFDWEKWDEGEVDANSPFQNWAGAQSIPEHTETVVPLSSPGAVRGQAPYSRWKDEKLKPRTTWVLPRLETMKQLQDRAAMTSLQAFEILPEREDIFVGVSSPKVKRIVLQWIYDLKLRTFGSRWMRVQEFRKHPKERIFVKYLELAAVGGDAAVAAAPLWKRCLLFVDGTMPEFAAWCDGLHNSVGRNLLVHLRAYMRGAAQVMLANNVVTGLLAHLALGLTSPWLLVCFMLGLFTATEFAFFLGTGANSWQGGLFGYNGALVGGAMAVFLGGGEWNALALPLIFFGAIFSVIVTLALGNMFAPTLGVPPFTIPFILTTWILIGAMHGSVHFPPDSSLVAGSSNVAPPFAFFPSAGQFFSAWLSGVGQIYFASSPYSGAVFVIGMAFYSRVSALACLAGPLVGLASAMMFGVGEEAFVSGLWGYNPSLLMIAIFGVFYVPSWKVLLLAVVGAFMSSFVKGFLDTIMAPFGIPQLTMAFSATAFLFLLIQFSITHVSVVPLANVTTPEAHYKKARTIKRFMRLGFRRV